MASGFLSGLGNFLLNGVSSWFGSNLSRRQQEALMQRQFEYNKFFAQNSHQMEVNDLRKAGLNPILSANNGATGSVGLGSVSDLGMSDSGTKSINTAMQMSMLKSNKANIDSSTAKNQQDIETGKAQASLFGAQANTAQSQARYNEALTALTDMETLMKKEEFKWLPKRLKMEIETGYKNASANMMSALNGKVTASAQAMDAETRRMLYYLDQKYRPWESGSKVVGTAVGAVGRVAPRTTQKVIKFVTGRK